MTLDELKGLNHGEVVVIIKVDESMKIYDYVVGDELTFLDLSLLPNNGCYINFLRSGDQPKISYFSYGICDYIERKMVLERDKKIDLLINNLK
jgi:hypothetical protein